MCTKPNKKEPALDVKLRLGRYNSPAMRTPVPKNHLKTGLPPLAATLADADVQ